MFEQLRLAIRLGNAGYAGSVEEMREVLAVAHTLGLEVDRLEIRRGEDIAPAFEQLKNGVQVLYVCTDALANANRHRINPGAGRAIADVGRRAASL
jgi:ABC-type uncharacterized transport system substrate-binding protein